MSVGYGGVPPLGFEAPSQALRVQNTSGSLLDVVPWAIPGAGGLLAGFGGLWGGGLGGFGVLGGFHGDVSKWDLARHWFRNPCQCYDSN